MATRRTLDGPSRERSEIAVRRRDHRDPWIEQRSRFALINLGKNRTIKADASSDVRGHCRQGLPQRATTHASPVTWLPVSARANRRRYGTCVTRTSPLDMVEFLVSARPGDSNLVFDGRQFGHFLRSHGDLDAIAVAHELSLWNGHHPGAHAKKRSGEYVDGAYAPVVPRQRFQWCRSCCHRMRTPPIRSGGSAQLGRRKARSWSPVAWSKPPSAPQT